MVVVHETSMDTAAISDTLTPFEFLRTNYLERKHVARYDATFWLTLISNLHKLVHEKGLEHPDTGCWSFLLSVYEDVVETFPTWGHVWRLYAESVTQISGREAGLNVYKRGLEQTHSLELNFSYVQCVYQGGHLLPLVDALTRAVSTVGMDIRSRPLWRELLALRIKMHNMPTDSVEAAPAKQLILLDSLASAKKKTTQQEDRLFTDEQLSLLVSAAQDLAMTLPSLGDDVVSQDPHLRQLQERLSNEQSFDKVRAVYRDWLATPTDGLPSVWQGYTQFEQTLCGTPSGGAASRTNSSHRVLTTKMLNSGQTLFLNSQKAFTVLTQLMQGIHSQLNILGALEAPAVPLTDSNASVVVETTKQWLRVLSYEISNPMHLPHSSLCSRIEGVFEICMASCGFQPALWMLYVQTLFSLDRGAQAINCLQKAVHRFLPRDEFLTLVLSDLLRIRGHAESSFRLLLSTVIEATPEGTLLRQALCAALRKGLPLRYKPIWSQIVPEEETNAAASRISTGTEDSTLEDSDASLDSYIPVDTVILLHLINFVRNVSDLTHAHALFLALHPFGPPQLYLYHAQVLWSVGGDRRLAEDVLALGANRFLDSEDYALGQTDILLQMGALTECRKQLLAAASRIYAGSKTAPLRLWSKIFQIETRYGPNGIQKRQELYNLFAQQQTPGSGDKLTTCCADDFLFRGFSGCFVPLSSDADHFELSPPSPVTQSLNPSTFLDKDRKSGFKENEMRQRVYGCGVSLQELYKSMSFYASFPKTSLTHFLAAANHPTTFPAASFTEEKGTNETRAKSSGQQRITETYNNAMISAGQLEQSENGYVPEKKKILSQPIVRPDSSKMLLFNPLLSAAGSTAGDTWLAENAAASSLCVSQIPLPLQHFIAMLPCISPFSVFGRERTDERYVIDHILLTLQTAAIPPVSIKEYTPFLSPSDTGSPANTKTLSQVPQKYSAKRFLQPAPDFAAFTQRSADPTGAQCELMDPPEFGGLWKRARQTLANVAKV